MGDGNVMENLAAGHSAWHQSRERRMREAKERRRVALGMSAALALSMLLPAAVIKGRPAVGGGRTAPLWARAVVALPLFALQGTGLLNMAMELAEVRYIRDRNQLETRAMAA